MNVLIFGATGSAGGGVLRACLASPMVESVRAIARRPLSLSHEKLRVFEHRDYLNYDQVAEAFVGVDACFFCLGISVNQVPDEKEYRTITYDFALAAAHALRRQSPAAVFHYLSGQGANLNSRFMWARVKAEAERDLIDQFDALCWRPAFIDGEASENALWLYQALRPLSRLFSPFRGLYITGQDLGKGMIQGTIEKMHGRVVENREIRDMAERNGIDD